MLARTRNVQRSHHHAIVSRLHSGRTRHQCQITGPRAAKGIEFMDLPRTATRFFLPPAQGRERAEEGGGGGGAIAGKTEDSLEARAWKFKSVRAGSCTSSSRRAAIGPAARSRRIPHVFFFFFFLRTPHFYTENVVYHWNGRQTRGDHEVDTCNSEPTRSGDNAPTTVPRRDDRDRNLLPVRLSIHIYSSPARISLCLEAPVRRARCSRIGQ